MKKMRKIPCVYMRGGTSKAVIFHEKDLPEDKSLWDEIFLKVMGSPDPKQIDGMGGTVSSTSKIAVLAPSKRPGIDVDYTFFQVDVRHAVVGKNVNCGNISSTVGPFAIDEGLVIARTPLTTVRIYNTNTDKVIEETVQVENGEALVYGDTGISGVPGTGARIDVSFFDPAGSMTGKLFPTGNLVDVFEVPGFPAVKGTLVDAGTTTVFVRASDLGIQGTELLELNSNTGFMKHLLGIRGLAAVMCGFTDDWKTAEEVCPAAPDIVLVTEPVDYQSLDGCLISASDMDLCARCFSSGMLHKAYPVTTSIATGAAAHTAGTIVADMLSREAAGKELLRIGHISGTFPVTVTTGDGKIEKASVIRTARRIMDGTVYIK